MLEATVEVFTQDQCKSFYPDHVITDGMMCAGSASGAMDACQVIDMRIMRSPIFMRSLFCWFNYFDKLLFSDIT